MLRVVPHQPVERGALGELVEARYAALVAQERLRRHQDQRLADLAPQLPSQDVEIVRRRGAVRDLHVVFAAHLQEALEAGRGVLRALALIAVRQETDERGQAQPLALARGNELVEHHLRAVGEVAELRLPQHEGVRLGERIAVFEAEHRLLREHRVDDLEAGLAVAQVLQRRVAALVVLVDEDAVALREGAALDILAREADRVAFEQERAEGERFRGGPVDPLARLEHALAVVEEALDRAMEMESGRNRGNVTAEILQGLGWKAGLAPARIVGVFPRRLEAGPASVEPIALVRLVPFTSL